MKGSFSKETAVLRRGSVKCQKLVLSTELIKSIVHREGGGGGEKKSWRDYPLQCPIIAHTGRLLPIGYLFQALG